MLVERLQESSEARMRGCYFHVPSGMGIFGSVPLLQQISDEGKGPEVGLRYSSPDITAGAIALPLQQTQTIWAVSRVCGIICARCTHAEDSRHPNA